MAQQQRKDYSFIFNISLCHHKAILMTFSTGFPLLRVLNLVQYMDQQWEFFIIHAVESVYIPCFFSGKNLDWLCNQIANTYMNTLYIKGWMKKCWNVLHENLTREPNCP